MADGHIPQFWVEASSWMAVQKAPYLAGTEVLVANLDDDFAVGLTIGDGAQAVAGLFERQDVATVGTFGRARW